MTPYFTFSRAELAVLNTNLKKNAVGVYIATAGNLTVTELSGLSVTYITMPVGAYPLTGVKQITAMPANTLVLYA